ncbi:MAG: hypothetical protein DHS20C18_03820 [Saprospiraceae bacterium]|nr:MAG: hypothetical protein DHS20C18_03820 [Saprospiraceae bacterium]
MTNASGSIFDKAYDPVHQAIVTFGGVVVFILISKLLDILGLLNVPERFPWMTAAAFILLFSIFNSVLSLASKDIMKYWGRSIYCFLGLAASSGLVAYLSSSIPIGEAGSYRWIYIVLTIGYLVFLSIVAFIKQIVEFAQKEEWNHPRIRRKNKK